jgi:hypothetical protein
MPVFLALALISDQPLNLVPDDCPQLPPFRICMQRYIAASLLFNDLLEKVPTPQDAERIKGEREAAHGLALFWEGAVMARSIGRWNVPPQYGRWSESRRALVREGCRRYLGEALWQKGGWWK